MRSGLYDKRYRIYFTNLKVQNAFFKLLENPCPKCEDAKTFVSFELLKKHVSREHQHYYCDLCTEHLKIFPYERRCYNRTDLALHNRKGDADDKSHRGHPLCEYCDVRYLDRDELFRHLRREHYYCHFCDADGSNQFYEDYPSLREHFQRDHFVCDEGSCATEQFTGVFRTDIDLKAHQAKHHSATMGKFAAKQARTLELEFSLVPRNRAGNGPGGGGGGASGANAGGSSSGGSRRNGATASSGPNPYANLEPGPSQIDLMPRQVPKRVVVDSNNEQEFPSLGGATVSASSAANAATSSSIRSKAFKATGGKLTRTNENFPALGGGGGAGPGSGSGPSGQYKKVSASAVLKAKPAAPAPSVEPTSSKTNTVIHISNRPRDFPALGRGGGRNAATGEDQSPVVTQMMSQLHVNNSAISAKHRGLVDEYTVATAVAQKPTAKIALVKAAAAPASPSKAAAAPVKLKLKSEENFPSLSAGGPSTTAWTAQTPKWVNKPKVESRKAKVAENPMANGEAKKEKKQKSSNNQTKHAKGDGKSSDNGQQSPLMANGLILGNGPVNKSGGKVAPPGFNPKPPSAGPPPGFNVTLNSVNNSNGTLMFSGASGNYKIVPTRRYIPPPDIQKRNQVRADVIGLLRMTNDQCYNSRNW